MNQPVQELMEQSGLNKSPDEIYAEYVQNTKRPPVSNSLRWRFVRFLKRRALVRLMDNAYDPNRTLTRDECNALHEEIKTSHVPATLWGIQFGLALIACFKTGAGAGIAGLLFATFLMIHLLLTRIDGRRMTPTLLRYLKLPLMSAEYAVTSFCEKSMTMPDARLKNEECFVEPEPMPAVVKRHYNESLISIRREMDRRGDKYGQNLNVLNRKRYRAQNAIQEISQAPKADPQLLQRAQEWLREIEKAIAITRHAEGSTGAMHLELHRSLDELEQRLWDKAQHAKLDADIGRHSGERDKAERKVNVWLDAMRVHVHALYQSLEETPALEEATEEETEAYTPLVTKLAETVIRTFNAKLPKETLEPTS